jgi:hypothetical protein
MKRWGLFTIFVAVQALLVAIAMAPGLVTFAQLPHADISCASCSSPEVKAALAQAASLGRAQVQQLVLSELWILIGVALVGVGVALRITIRVSDGNRQGES